MRRTLLNALLHAHRDGRTLVRAVDLDSGAEMLIDPQTDQSPTGRIAASVAKIGATKRISLEGRNWLFSVYGQRDELVIIGAVHIAQALASLAGASGYRVRVIDPRAGYASQERFPDIALQHAWPDEALKEQPLTERSALIALAHDPKLDDLALALALRSPAFYIGALGSARTHKARLARLEALGFETRDLSRICGPVGLSIGARTPAEIAIAILAGLVQTRQTTQRPRIAGILLAAGRSSRMGQNKLAMPVRGKPLVRHAAEAALAAGLESLLVITGHEPEVVHASLSGLAVRFVHNPHYDDGLSTSLQAGIRAVPRNCDGALVLLGDLPAISPRLIDRLIAGFRPANGRSICVATVKGKRGHPVLWDRRFFAEIESLSGDTGAKKLMSAHPEQVYDVEAEDGAPLADIDTLEDLRAYFE